MSDIAIIDYGMGNLRSVQQAVAHISGQLPMVTSDPDKIRHAQRIIFPGQGAARDCMKAIRENGINDLIIELVQQKPFLGICMGLQVLMDFSEENNGVEELGIFSGTVKRFQNNQVDSGGQKLKIPHMGWNQVRQVQPHFLWRNIPDDSRFYFVHSYYIVPVDTSSVVGTTQHGLEFASVLAKENVFATQFHPEKSQEAGLQLLKNFIEWRV